MQKTSRKSERSFDFAQDDKSSIVFSPTAAKYANRIISIRIKSWHRRVYEQFITICQAALDRAAGCFRSNGNTFSTKASAVRPCLFRRIGIEPCSTN
jgi:hypothetical protein